MRRVRMNLLLRLTLLLCFSYSMVSGAEASSACFAPFNIQISSSTTNSIDITWTDFTTPSDFIQYELAIALYGEEADFMVVDTSFTKSFSFQGLLEGQSYEVYLRTICNSGTTNWTSASLIQTNLFNYEACNSKLVIKDDNCPFNSNFILEVFANGFLGQDVFIQNIELTIDHSWPADLNLSLISPSGKSVLLVQNQGIGHENYGDVNNPCLTPLSLNMDACESVSETQEALVGSFQPEGDLTEFYDGSSPTGEWIIEICDDAQGQIGILSFFNLNFTDIICSAPNDLFIRNLEDESLSLIVPASNCDSLEILYMDTENNIPTKVYVPCTGDTIQIDNLLNSTEYLLSYSAMCDGNLISSSCPKTFVTRCSKSTNYTDFDEQDLCANSCSESCNIEGIWQNASESAPWLVNADKTGTAFTGPDQDYFGSGNYIYIESSDTFCNNNEAVLLSSCMEVIAGSECNLSFAYHMFGNDISYLALDISVDNMENWINIWENNGNQGNNWLTQSINLEDYIAENIQLRFRSMIPENNFGDIAIDEIVLSNIQVKSDEEILIYLDEDQDNFGKNGTGIAFCGSTIPIGFSDNNLDCNDDDPLINPDAIESPCNIQDDNCNGQIDEDMEGSTLDYSLIAFQDQNCNGVADGFIKIEGIGGIAPYTYTWLDGTNGNQRTNLTSGIYQAIIEDQGGCQILTDTFFVETLQNFDFFISSVTPATCDGINDGKINVSHDESNAPYSYLWSSGDTTKNIMNKAVGNYQLNITDVNGCIIETDSVYLMPTRIVEIEIDSIDQISCSSLTDGYLSVKTINNVGPVSYLWENGSVENIRSSLSAGNYQIEVQDSTGCRAENQFTITEPNQLDVKISVNDPVICYGDENGLLQADIQGGTMPYDILWSTGDSSIRTENLVAGSYHITVIDANLCSDTMSNIIVVQPDSLKLEILDIQPAICQNNNSGTIEISASGGNDNYHYFWSDNIDHNTLADKLSAGNYTVTMTDAFECKVSLEEISVPFVEIKLLSQTIETKELNCFEDQSGEITLELLNSTKSPNYFVYNNDSISSLNNIFTNSNLAAETYNIVIRDGNGCETDSIHITLEQPTEIEINLINLENLNCFQDSTGIIDLEIVGGNEPYDILWNNNNDTSYNDQLKAGIYQLTVTDANDCIDSLINLEITEPEELKILAFEATDLSCFGDSTGTISINLNSGGTAPYYYKSDFWQDSTASIHQGLDVGNYEIIISDANNCIADTLFLEINSPDLLELSLDSINNSICEGENGSIFLESEGGTGNKTFDWDGFMGDGAFAQNITSGTYSVTITDENGCKDSVENIILNNVDLEIELSLEFKDSVSCYNGSNGIISSMVGNEATGPYSFYLNNQLYQNNDSPELFISDLMAGEYLITVIDGNNCKDTIENILIEQPPVIEYELTLLDSIRCYKDTNAIIAISASGGNGSLEFLWNNTEQGDTLFNLGAGVYTCAIIDKKNCIQFTDTIFLDQPDSLYLIANIVDATNDNNDGGIYIQTFGGTAPYIYQWDPYLPTEVDTIEGLAESFWELTLVDNNGCLIDTSFTINRVVNTSDLEENNVELYPTLTTDYLILRADEKIDVWRIYNAYGQLVSSKSDIHLSEIKINVLDLTQGNYFLELQLNGKKVVRPFIKI